MEWQLLAESPSSSTFCAAFTSKETSILQRPCISSCFAMQLKPVWVALRSLASPSLIKLVTRPFVGSSPYSSVWHRWIFIWSIWWLHFSGTINIYFFFSKIALFALDFCLSIGIFQVHPARFRFRPPIVRSNQLHPRKIPNQSSYPSLWHNLFCRPRNNHRLQRHFPSQTFTSVQLLHGFPTRPLRKMD